MRILPLLLLSAAGPGLYAQDTTGQAGTSHDLDRYRPAIPGELDGLRYPEVAPPTGLALDPTPVYADRASEGPGAPISVDLRTGVETLHPMPTGPYAPFGYVTGRQVGEEVRESLGRSFNQLSSISSTAFPWSAHVRMYFDQSGLTYVCSGTMIDPQNFITAGHCVHEGAGGAWSTNVVAYPAWDGDADAYGSANGVNMVTWSNWTGSSSWDGDQAIVTVDRPVGFLTGWFGYGYNDSDSWWSSTTFNTTGYPGGSSWPGAPDQQYYGYGSWDQVDTYTVEADCPPWTYWFGGMSGGGVYWIDTSGGSTQRYVEANNSYGWGKASNITSRFGVCRMTSGKFDYYLNTFIPNSYPSTQEDLEPLDVNADMGGATIMAGTQLASMDYLVANSSLFDPASQSWPVDTYLSTNDNISTFDTLIQSHTFTWDFAPKSTVRVTYSTPPTIPSTTSAGTYWLGVILDITDADVGNNDSDGWDAVEISVVDPPPYWPNLPTSFLGVNGNRTIDFDTAAGTLQSWMAANALAGDHLSSDPEAWCNIGQQGACATTTSGAYCLEMGLDPASTNYHEVANGFILGLDGAGDGDLFLDYQGINHGEEASTDDGVWISADGVSWTALQSGWAGVGSAWGETAGIAMSGSGVSTNGDFYLMFAQQDNFPYGYLDGIGIDDIVVDSYERQLSITPVTAGLPLTISVSNCTPGSAVYVAWSAAGGGPTGTAWGTAYLTAPWVTLPTFVPDASGFDSLTQNANAGTTGIQIWLHGLELPAGEFLNPLAIVIG